MASWSLWPRPRHVLPGGRKENSGMQMTGCRRHQRKWVLQEAPEPIRRPVAAFDGKIRVVGDTYSCKAGLGGT